MLHLKTLLPSLLALAIVGCPDDRPVAAPAAPTPPARPPEPPPPSLPPPEPLVGQDVDQCSAGKQIFKPGGDYHIKGLGRRTLDSGKVQFVADCRPKAETPGSKTGDVSLIIVFGYTDSEGSKVSFSIGDSSAVKEVGPFSVSSQDIDMGELSGKGSIFAFLMPHDSMPPWLFTEGDVSASSNIFEAIVEFGKN